MPAAALPVSAMPRKSAPYGVFEIDDDEFEEKGYVPTYQQHAAMNEPLGRFLELFLCARAEGVEYHLDIEASNLFLSIWSAADHNRLVLIMSPQSLHKTGTLGVVAKACKKACDISGKRMDVEIPVVDPGWIVVVPMAIVSWKSDVRARTSSV